MSTREFLTKVHTYHFGRLDAFNKSFDFTNGDKRKIELLLMEIEDFETNKKRWHDEVLTYYFNLFCEYENHQDFDLFFALGYDDDHLDSIKNDVDLYCTTHNINDFWQYPKNLEELFYPDMFDKLRQLKRDLMYFIEPQQPEQTTPEKKQPKDVWGFKARYNFLDDLGVLKPLQTSGISKKNLQIIVSQILGCNVYTARDLINGDYNTIETKDEQLERKQLIDLIKYKPME